MLVKFCKETKRDGKETKKKQDNLVFWNILRVLTRFINVTWDILKIIEDLFGLLLTISYFCNLKMYLTECRQ